MQLFFRLSKFVPYDVYKSVFDIDYSKLYEEGKRLILMDIDNTLIPYDIQIPNQEILDLFEKLKRIGFEVIFISNNHRIRVRKFSEALKIRYISDAWKPFKNGYRKALKYVQHYTIPQIVSIGDQLMTDILGSNRMGIDAILVRPIKRKTEKWYTKFNRIIEQRILNRLRNKFPDVYNKIEGLDNENKM